MIEKKKDSGGTGSRVWILYAIGSAVFASLTAILGKIGITGVDSTLGTAIRTVAVLVMAWGMVGITGKRRLLRRSSGKELFYLFLSALATGTAWLCYYRALQEGPASAVVPIDKMSILVTVVFSYLVFGEKLTARSGTGLVLCMGMAFLMGNCAIAGCGRSFPDCPASGPCRMRLPRRFPWYRWSPHRRLPRGQAFPTRGG